MKGRIARLEGSTRKSDSSNKSLKKYITMLEKALRERDAQVKALKAGRDLSSEPTKEEGKEILAGKNKEHRRRFLAYRLVISMANSWYSSPRETPQFVLRSRSR
jgi:septal ring factor EnvC (AmiA/AmiB activator)